MENKNPVVYSCLVRYSRKVVLNLKDNSVKELKIKDAFFDEFSAKKQRNLNLTLEDNEGNCYPFRFFNDDVIKDFLIDCQAYNPKDSDRDNLSRLKGKRLESFFNLGITTKHPLEVSPIYETGLEELMKKLFCWKN